MDGTLLKGDKELREQKKKPEKKKPLTNAQKCKAHRERRKQDSALCEIDTLKKKEANRLYYAALTPEQKEQRKLVNTLYQRERRKRLNDQQLIKQNANSTNSPMTPKKTKGKDKQTLAYCTRDRTLQNQSSIDARREKNRLRQQKRRKNMHPEKKKRELQLKRERYHKQKEISQETKSGARQQTGISKALFNVKASLKKARSKMCLWELSHAELSQTSQLQTPLLLQSQPVPVSLHTALSLPSLSQLPPSESESSSLSQSQLRLQHTPGPSGQAAPTFAYNDGQDMGFKVDQLIDHVLSCGWSLADMYLIRRRQWRNVQPAENESSYRKYLELYHSIVPPDSVDSLPKLPKNWYDDSDPQDAEVGAVKLESEDILNIE